MEVNNFNSEYMDKEDMHSPRIPLFSIIVASYNYADFIGETLDSLVHQTFTDYEIIVIDDGSSDNSIDIVNDFAKKHKDVKLYTHPGHENRGLVETIRLGIQKATGRFIAFCESDDIWAPNHLEEKAKAIQLMPKVCILSNDVEIFGDEESVKVRKEYAEHIKSMLTEGANRIDLIENGEVNVIPTFSAVTIRKSLLEQLDFSSPIPAWIDFWLYRQILRNHDLYFIPLKLTRWRMHESYNDINKSAEYMARSKAFLAESNRLICLNFTEKKLYDLAKNQLHYSDSYKETANIVRYFQKGNYSKKLKRKLKRKFVWYRMIQFWRNHPFNGYQEPDHLYQKLIHTERQEASILIFVHEMTLTGAPRAALTMATVLSEMGLYPVIVSPKGGPLIHEARQHGITTIVDILLDYKFQKRNELLHSFIRSFDHLVFNTIETYRYASFLSDLRDKSIGWIHEGSISIDDANNRYHLESLIQSVGTTYFVSEYSRDCAAKYIDLAKISHGLLLYGCEDIPRSASSQPRKTGKIKILMIGTIDERKGMFLIDDAVKLLSPSTTSLIEINIVGGTDNKKALKRIRSIRHDCVRYLGPKSHEEVIDIFRDMDIFLCPSLDDPMPIVCTEAMMFHKVIITSDHTGTASLIEEGINGFVIRANDPKAISDAITNCLGQRERFKSIGDNARAIYDKSFTIKAFKERLKVIFPI